MKKITPDIWQLHELLNQWFHQHQRYMPWRDNQDPYRIWISEIMLQQTRVETVLPYFINFISRYASVQALAGANEQDVMKLWEGLGYYARARNLIRGALRVVEHFKGKIPCTYKELCSIPGIGDYTAGAILSIAFNMPVPAVDGNVLRVIARLYAVEKDVTKLNVKSEIRALVSSIIPDGHASSFNQGLMELGAMICTPKSPKCNICPWYLICVSRILNLQYRLPLKTPKKPVQVVRRIIAVIFDGQRVLVHKRPSKGLLGGLWEFPGWEFAEDQKQSITNKLLQIGIITHKVLPIIEVQHTFTHLCWNMSGFLCITDASIVKVEENHEYRWVLPEELHDLPFPVAFKQFVLWAIESLPGFIHPVDL